MTDTPSHLTTSEVEEIAKELGVTVVRDLGRVQPVQQPPDADPDADPVPDVSPRRATARTRP